jgi:hypothetical protein
MSLTDPPPPIDPLRSAKRINRAMFFLGAALFFAGLKFFTDEDALERTSIGRALPGAWDDAWSVTYLLGGLLIMVGILLRGARGARVEMPGITLAAAGLLANGIAIVIVLGANRGLGQLPLYVLAMWVLDGRIRDLRDLPRERRHGRRDDRLVTVERRANISIVPLLALAGSGSVGVSLLVAVIGGGFVTALVQVALYRPQTRDIESRLSKQAVEAAASALGQARSETEAVTEELERAKERIASLEASETRLLARCRDLEQRLSALEP